MQTFKNKWQRAKNEGKQRKKKKKLRWSFQSSPFSHNRCACSHSQPLLSHLPSPSSFPKVLLSSRALQDFSFAVNGWVRSLQVEREKREHCGTNPAPVSFSLQRGPPLICWAFSPEHPSSWQHGAVCHNLGPNHFSYGQFRSVKIQCVLYQTKEVWKVSREKFHTQRSHLCVWVLIT